jgi:hypothetical protein
MSSPLVSYLAGRPDTATFLIPGEMGRTVDELFPRTDGLLPQPYKIFPADETQQPALGFPVADAAAMKELDAKLDRWLTDEVGWQVGREQSGREKAQLSLATYMQQLMRLAENALMANLLSDYHAVFWLAHSFDLSRHFSAMTRRVSGVDMQAGRTQGDTLKYRIFARWASETREQMTALATRAASILDGEEQRGLQFFRLLQDDVLILTEEFIGPDLREMRSFVTGYLRRDFQQFRDGFEKLRNATSELLQRDRTFRGTLPLFGANPDQGITVALLLDNRFQGFLFEHPAVQNTLSREDREQFQLIARRLREFAVLNQLRRGITWMSTTTDGRIVSTDKRTSFAFSRSTRPMDFGKPGVVDPMIHRFGLIYDISNFSETLGNLRRAGSKQEVSSYRQMLLFQRRMEAIADRHLLQFEKFLGDGAFYTTRRALRLVRAAVEIQRFYAEMKRKNFAFNRGLRIALNYGYYRLLPMKGTNAGERINEFYGPGIVELSRLTTGKANKEIEEIAAFLVSHGYDSSNVQNFFAPLKRGVDLVDKGQTAREFYAYIDSNGHLINEGIVASASLLSELSQELSQESQQLYRLRGAQGTYIGFSPAIGSVEYVGMKLLGMVALKGLDDIEVGEIIPYSPGDVEATPLDPGENLLQQLRQEYHQPFDNRDAAPVRRREHDTDESPLVELFDDIEPQQPNTDSTYERLVPSEIVVCARARGEDDGEVLIGEWDPVSDDVYNAVRLPRGDFQKLFSIHGSLTSEQLTRNKDNVREIYQRLLDRADPSAVALAAYRVENEAEAFVLGDVVEKL